MKTVIERLIPFNGGVTLDLTHYEDTWVVGQKALGTDELNVLVGDTQAVVVNKIKNLQTALRAELNGNATLATFQGQVVSSPGV